jgi:hypothetical protein
MYISKKNYMLVNLPYIKKDIAHFKKYADLAHKRFEHKYGKQSTTGLYNQYNSMTLLVGSVKYYKMFKDVFTIMVKYSR